MNIVLVGHGSLKNRGCEAIIRTTVSMLNDEFKMPRITIASFDYKHDKKVDLGRNVKFIRHSMKHAWQRWTKDWFIRILYTIIYSDKKKWRTEFLPIIPAIRRSDIVLSVGGDNYTTDYGLGGLSYFLRLNRLIKDLGKKIVIWGASIGPFPEDKNIDNIIDNLKSVDLITVREPCTIKYLSSLGIRDNVKRVADPAFLLDSKPVKIDNLLNRNNNKTVGFNISPLLLKFSKSAGANNILDEVSNFLQQLIDKYSFNILLIPHVTKDDGDNDCVVMRQILNSFKKKENIFLVDQSYDAMEIKHIISKCDYFIGARTHSTIASLSSGVPTLCIGYSSKARGINLDIYGNDDYVIDIREFSKVRLVNKFVNLIDNENTIKMLLSEKSGYLKQKALDNIVYLKELLYAKR